MTQFKRKRQITRKADAILAADLHIRANTPLCRTDNYLEVQFNKLNFIFDLCQKNDCPLLVAGDIGDKSQWPNWLLEAIINIMKVHKINIFCIPGQHDLPEHRLDYWYKSGCGVLYRAGTIKFMGISDLNQNREFKNFDLHAFPYGEKIQHIDKRKYHLSNSRNSIAMTHQMVIENKPLWPDQKAPKGHELLKKFPEYDLILSGDNHNPFISEYEGRLLVNPGSMMRMTAAQIDHKPRIYKWCADTNEVEVVYLPIEKDVVSRIHIETKQERDERMDTFVNRISDDIEIGLSFEQNLKEYFNKNRTKKSIQGKVWKAVET